MRRAIAFGTAAVLVTAGLALVVPALPVTPGSAEPGLEPESGRPEGLLDLPLAFVENRGQVEEGIGFYTHGRDASVLFSPGGATFVLSGAAPGERWGLRMDLVGADGDVAPRGAARLEGVVSYFTGAPDSWHTAIPTYGEVVYQDLWPGIDLVFSGDQRSVKYAFEVAPGADPSAIRVAWRGASRVALTDAGELAIETGVGTVVDAAPTSWQVSAGRRIPVPSSYEALGDGTFGFALGGRDPSLPLVIDPVVFVYAGFIGGFERDQARGIAVDDAGSAYVVGETASLEDSFPDGGSLLGLVGPDDTWNGVSDAYVVKLAPDGLSYEYAGFIGGAATDIAYGVDVDADGAAYVVGLTESALTFPDGDGFGAVGGPDQTFNGVTDAFIAKVAPDGTSLEYAGFIGGDMSDYAYDVRVGADEAAYVVGTTGSDDTTFPDGDGVGALSGADVTYNGGNDAYVIEVLPDGSALSWVSYVGGSGLETGTGLDLGPGEDVFLAGATTSTQATFPDGDGVGALPGPDLTQNGGTDGYVVKLRGDGSSFGYVGFVGGAASDTAADVAVDLLGAPYVAGQTDSTGGTFPDGDGIGALLTFDGSANGDTDAFVVKVRPNGSAFRYAGFVGGAGDDRGSAVDVDAFGGAHVAGNTDSTEATFPDGNGFGSVTGADVTHNGDTDAFAVKVGTLGVALAQATYVGGDAVDDANAIAVDIVGVEYVAGNTSSDETTFPDGDGFGTITGPDTSANGDDEGWVAKVAALCPGLGLVAGNHIVGTPGPDTLTGTADTDIICGLGGADTIDGLGGDDLILGGGGIDTIDGGADEDVILGGLSGDILTGGGQDDVIRGGFGPDELFGGSGDDTLLGQQGGDTIRGQNNDDTIEGHAGADDLEGNSGIDDVDGSDGAGGDTVNGGSEVDTCSSDPGDIVSNCP